MKYLRIIILLLFSTTSFSQPGPNSNWYFGTNAGITFNSGTPVALTNGALTTTEGVATISDNSGNLLFYTNGVTVWNRNHLVMTNGAGLLGDISSTQSSIIIQKPLSNNIYYIFTSDNDAGTDGIRWSEVDMTLSAGLGAITTNKNIALLSPNQFSCEKLCAVRHCNNQDIWIISKDWNSNVFRCWAIGDVMVGTSPWYQQSWSGAGVVPSGATQGAYGQLKASPNGRKLAACYYGLAGGINKIEIYDFDPNTGFVTNAQTISTETGIYGCEFSPDGKILYAGCNQGLLLQWNLCAGNLAQIQASRRVISNAGAFIGSLQTGPDGKIYVSRNATSLSVINNPNVVGTGCNYQDLSIPLAGRLSRFGLPNFASYYVTQTTTVAQNQINCNTFSFTTPNFQGSCGSPVYTYSWNFGDGNTSNNQNPQHTYNSNGNYVVTLTVNTGCVPITATTNVVVNSAVNTGPIYKQ
jgi:hypothetical protein